MPHLPSAPTQCSSLELLITCLQTLTAYTNIARAHCIFYLTPCLPLLTPVIYSLTFIMLCYLFRRTLLYFHYPPAKSFSTRTNKQAHQMAAAYEIQVDYAYSNNQYRQRPSEESDEEGTEDFSLWTRLFACCAARPSEREKFSSSRLLPRLTACS